MVPNYDKTMLINDLAAWVDNEDVLAEARKFLEPDVDVELWGKSQTYQNRGLGEMRIANWKKAGRGIPEGVVEGAALYHCGRPAMDPLALQRTQLTAREAWQVFVVSDERIETTKKVDGKDYRLFSHHCGVTRYWDGVQYIGQRDAGNAYLTHKTWFTGKLDKSSKLFDIVSDRELEKDVDWRVVEGGHRVSVSFQVKESNSQDYGYHLHLSGTVDANPPKQRHEYLGGLSVIPAEKLFIVASIPNRLLAESTEILPTFKYKVPLCLEFLPDGVPTQAIEEFLAGELHPRWLGQWFKRREDFQVWNREAFPLPARIERALKREETPLERENCSTFMVQINSPAPYLYYSLVFELSHKTNPTSS